MRDFEIRVPVVSLVPRSTTGYRLRSLRDARWVERMNLVVSLRSTTGYWMASLWDDRARLEARGFPSCSRWLSEARATPPENDSQKNRTPAGVADSSFQK